MKKMRFLKPFLFEPKKKWKEIFFLMLQICTKVHKMYELSKSLSLLSTIFFSKIAAKKRRPKILISVISTFLVFFSINLYKYLIIFVKMDLNS